MKAPHLKSILLGLALASLAGAATADSSGPDEPFKLYKRREAAEPAAPVHQLQPFMGSEQSAEKPRKESDAPDKSPRFKISPNLDWFYNYVGTGA